MTTEQGRDESARKAPVVVPKNPRQLFLDVLEKTPALKAITQLEDQELWVRLQNIDTSTSEGKIQRKAVLDLWAMNRATAAADDQTTLRGYRAFSHGIVNKGTFFGMASLANRAKATAHNAIGHVTNALTGAYDTLNGNAHDDWVLPREMYLAYYNAYDQALAAHHPGADMAGMVTGIVTSIALLRKAAPAAAAPVASGEAVQVASMQGLKALADTLKIKATNTALIGPAALIPAGTHPLTKGALACVISSATLGSIGYLANDGDLDKTRIGAINGCAFGLGVSAALGVAPLALKVAPVAPLLLPLSGDTPTTTGIPDMRTTERRR